MEKLICYDNGLKLIVENIASVRSVAAGIWVNTGSAYENDDDNGISHFTEHMLFKGTDKLSPFEIANSFEYLGASVNAFTSKECTCYYYKSISENAESCFKLLSHIFFDSAFAEEELDKERKVIAEEINMVEDSPEDICYDLLSEALYKGHPLSRTILGPHENVRRFKKNDIIKYTSKAYCTPDIVVSMAGNIDLATADKYIKKYFFPFACNALPNKNAIEKHIFNASHAERVKDFEQSNIAIAFEGLKFNDKFASVQSVLNSVLGGSMSSRLFQRVREDLGLAYSIYSSPSSFTNNGSFNILTNISVENTSKTLEAIRGELNRFLSDGITQEELTRAKTQLKSICIFSQENIQSIMSSNGKFLTLTGEVYDIDKKISEIDAVTVSDIAELADRLFKNKLPSTAYVGKAHGVDFNRFF